jgi:hypothetical protein
MSSRGSSDDGGVQLTVSDVPLATRLRHVRWVGGGSGAGKSTVAHQLADRHGLLLHHAEPPSKYLARSTPASAPLLHAFAAMDMDERWVNRSPQVMYETFHAFHGECFDLVIDDVLALPDDPPVLVEGFSLLPRLIAPLLGWREQAIWLLLSPAFRRSAFDHRGSTWRIPNKTSDPQRALENLLARDALFTEELCRQADALNLPYINVGSDLRVEDSVAEVGRALGPVA